LFTFFIRNYHGVESAQRTEQGNYPYCLILDSNKLSGDRRGQIQGNRKKQGHSRKDALEKSCSLEKFILKLNHQDFHFCIK
jgi:hypothetical protein